MTGVQTCALPISSSPVVTAALALATLPYVGFTDRGSNVPGISDWIEQLIAESTGKDGRGLLPVVLNSVDEPVGGGHPVVTFDGSGVASIVGPLGAQFIFWEWVTALLGYLLKVDPFNQPNVTEAKTQTLALDRKSTRLNSSHIPLSRMPSSA